MNKWVNRKLDKKRTTGKGFTLIELIVVVTVLGILAAIVIYAVGNISGAATKSAAGTSGSEVSNAEQAYCQANGVYGDLNQLVSGGYLTNPNPNITIYTYTIPTNAQLFNGCGTSVYDAFPQTITQPDGTAAVIAAPPTTVVSVDESWFGPEELAALGVTPTIGVTRTWAEQDQANAFGPSGFTPLVNAPNYTSVGWSPINYQAVAAAHPQLILGEFGMSDGASEVQSLEAIAPLLSIYTNNNTTVPTNPQPNDLELLDWLPTLVALAPIMNAQAQAAAFLTAFQNAAATVEPQLAGKTVSILFPYASGNNGSTVDTLQFQGPAYENVEPDLLEYLGMNYVCPNCGVPANGGRYNLPVANASATTVTAQYLVIEASSSTGLTADQALFGTQASPGTLGSVLPQIAAGGVWGPNIEATFGGGSGGTTPVQVTLPSPLSGYCSIAGVSTTVALPNLPTSQTGAWCPGYGQASDGTYFTPTQTGLILPPAQYASITVPGGFKVAGPITALASLPYIPAAFPTAAPS